MTTIKLVFKPDGTMEVQGIAGEDAAQKLDWLLRDLGNITKKGHKHGVTQQAGVHQEQKG